MPCTECEEKKEGGVICQDVWKDGAKNTMESGGRKVNENKLLSSARRFAPYSRKCKLCKKLLSEDGKYCHTCAYKKGICANCGKIILEDVKFYKQSLR